MKRNVVVLFVICTLLWAVAAPCIAQSSIQNVGKDAKIDWTNLVYIATGQGAIPSPSEEPNRARARLKARDYAKMDALANLLMAIEGTSISYEATGKDYMANTTVRQKIEGYVKNAEVTKYSEERYEGDTIVTAEVHAPMFGNGSPGNVLVDQAAQNPAAQQSQDTSPTVSAQAPTLEIVTKPDKPARIASLLAQPSEPGKPYTGLIIDASGYKIDRCMSPKIRKADGSEVWGSVNASYDLILDRGIVAYATSLADARKNSRVGSNPMIIRATGRAGGRFYCDPVIADEDAALLLSENGKSGFLDKYNVLFVKDPVPLIPPGKHQIQAASGPFC